MNSKTCRAVRQEIDEADLQMRPGAEAMTHLAACPSCRSFQHERAQLRELVGSLAPVMAPADFDMRLRARIAADRQMPVRGAGFYRFLVSTPAMAAAALVIMLGAGMIWFSQRNQNQPPASASNSGNQINSSAQNPATASKDTTVKTPSSDTNSGEAVATLQSTGRVDSLPGPGRRVGEKLITRSKASEAVFDTKAAVKISKTVDAPGEVSLSAPDKPMVVSVEDDSGTKRNISLPPVSFGSQRLVDNRITVSGPGRVW